MVFISFYANDKERPLIGISATEQTTIKNACYELRSLLFSLKKHQNKKLKIIKYNPLNPTKFADLNNPWWDENITVGEYMEYYDMDYKDCKMMFYLLPITDEN